MSDRKLIAVVDEDPMWLAVVGATLSGAGYHALLLGDASCAVQQIAREAPALAIIDAPAIARGLRDAMSDDCPPLVLVTDDLAELSDEDDRLFQAAYEKPVALDRVMIEVRRAIRGRKISGTVLIAEPALIVRTTKEA